MIDVKSGWKSVSDKEKWAARGATLMGKAKATKVVWFPPKPAETGRKAASTVKKAAKKTTGKAKTPRKTTRKPATKATGAARRAASGTKNAAS